MGKQLVDEQSIEGGQPKCRNALATVGGRTKKRKLTAGAAATATAAAAAATAATDEQEGVNEHQAMMTDMFAATNAALRVKSMPARMRAAKAGHAKRVQRNAKHISKAKRELARYKQEKAKWEDMKANQTRVEDVESVPAFARVG
eukprot:SAG11_NODE_4791_length_1765_cov_2.259304_3_plen_145_part_00